MTVTTDRPEAAVASSSGSGDRFVASTLLTLALILAGYQVITAPFIPPLTVFAVLFGGVGAALWRRRTRWLLVVAGVLALVYLGAALPIFIAHLAHPETPAAFVTDAFLVIGLVTVVLGVIGGLRGAGPGQRRSVAAVAVGLAALAVAISVAAALNVDSDAQQPGDVAIEVTRWVFPDVVDLPAGGATLWVDNHDPFHHTIVVEGTDVHGFLPASTAVRIPVDLAPGTYRYLCDVPGHETMTGELRVG